MTDMKHRARLTENGGAIRPALILLTGQFALPGPASAQPRSWESWGMHPMWGMWGLWDVGMMVFMLVF
jgi:hypothetical protein